MQAQLINKIILTDIQKQVLDGAMLGDGSLIIHKNGVNAIFSYLSKSRQHVEFVGEYFKEYWSNEGIKDSSYLDVRTNKTYFRSSIRTFSNATFTEQYYRWYPNKKKILPKDLILTPLVCLIWYIGDGGICHGKKSENIKLSTQCFSKEEQELILLPQLQLFEASLMKTDIGKNGEQQYCIYIPHRKEQDFLTYIGECPFPDYQYKWQVKEYINTIPQNHTDKEEIFCQKYKQGMSYYAIAKEFNIEPNAVKHYLIKNNLYQKPDPKTRFAVIQIDKNGNYINIFKSGVEAGRQLGLSSSFISQVKTGNKIMSDGSSFKTYLDLPLEEQLKIKEKFIKYF